MNEVMTKETVRGSEIQSGVCKFCGAIHQFKTDGTASRIGLDRWATEKCDCPKSQEEMEELDKGDNARDSIYELVGDSNPELVDILCAAVGLILEEAATKVTLDTGKGDKSISISKYER